jgi:hypothetical protein
MVWFRLQAYREPTARPLQVAKSFGGSSPGSFGAFFGDAPASDRAVTFNMAGTISAGEPGLCRAFLTPAWSKNRAVMLAPGQSRMILTAISPTWQITALSFITLIPLFLAMRWLAFRGAAEANKHGGWILSPFPFPITVKRALPLSAGPRILRRFFLALAVCICAYWAYWNLLQPVRVPPVILSYVGAILLWIVSETLGSAVVFLAVPWGYLLPLFHASPPLAKGVSDFWSRRWNVWTSDWFRQVIFCPLRTRPVLALLLVFLASGVFHEWVMNLPLYLVTGRNCFGSMIVYFLLQALGILIERTTHNRVVRRLLAWLFVFGAAPLIVNEGLLRILHLWPEG